MNINYNDMQQIARAMNIDNPYICVEGDTLKLQWWCNEGSVEMQVDDFNPHMSYFSKFMAGVVQHTCMFLAKCPSQRRNQEQINDLKLMMNV